MMLWDQKTLQTLKFKMNNMHLKAHRSFLIYRIELQFLSDFTQCCFPSLDPCPLRLATVDTNATFKN